MGWNDHVDFTETKCLECGTVDIWEYWDAVALARYSGDLGKCLGRDAKNSGSCPHCGSMKGIPVEDHGAQ